MHEVPINETKRVIMQKTTYQQKEWWQVAQQWRSEKNPEWMWKSAILIPLDKGKDLAKALRNFADAIERG